MKTNSFGLLAIGVIFLAACNSGNNKNKTEEHDMNKTVNDTQHIVTSDDKDIKSVAIVYPNLDVKAFASIKTIVDHYFHIKNALANDDAREAAGGAKAMQDALGKLDKSLLTAEQKQAYEVNEEEMKEHAEHIAKNGDDIEHQRSHFAMMSEVFYELVRNFGAGRPVYHDHCPMARENKGAMWISEIKEIKNPYFGEKMFKCGKVEEVIK